ncbi:MAG: hypothetical protein ABIQ38_08820 [Ilumatobacteraceae bacterium]
MAPSTHPPRVSDGLVPDGITETRNRIRQRGGLVAVEIAAAMAVVGSVLIWLPGPIAGVLGFLVINAALPALALAGVPAITEAGRILIAILVSAVVWWSIGHFAAVRASRNAIVDWTEWRSEFQPLAIGVWAGTILSIGVAAFVLGAL